MQVVRVPAPPPEAFNKDRKISDLIRAQVNHLKHVEHGLPLEQRSDISQHGISTESDAAKYIAQMTRLLMGKTKVPTSTSSASSKPSMRPVAASASSSLKNAPAKGPGTQKRSAAKSSPKGKP